MTRRVCCTTPAALCYSCAVFCIVYGAGLAAMFLWSGAGAFYETLLLGSLGVACLANFRRNRTYHCAITGPLFLAGAVVIGLTEAGVIAVHPGLVWSAVLLGAGLAALLELRFAVAARSGRGAGAADT